MPGLFRYNQGQQKEPEQPNGKFMGLIRLLWQKAWDITKINLISLLFYLPFIVVAWLATYWFIPQDRADILNSVIYATEDLQLADTIVRIIFGSIFITIPIIVFGPAAAGATAIYRSFVKGQSYFMWNDMWAVIKRFFVKAMAITLIDIAVMFISGRALFFYMNEAEIVMPALHSSFMETIVVMVVLIFLLLFFMMHFYIYQLLIEYDLKIVKLYKYSYTFALLRFFPNLLVLIACLVVTIGPSMINVFIGNGVFIFLSIAVSGTIINYYSWPAIEKHFEPIAKK